MLCKNQWTGELLNMEISELVKLGKPGKKIPPKLRQNRLTNYSHAKRRAQYCLRLKTLETGDGSNAWRSLQVIPVIHRFHCIKSKSKSKVNHQRRFLRRSLVVLRSWMKVGWLAWINVNCAPLARPLLKKINELAGNLTKNKSFLYRLTGTVICSVNSPERPEWLENVQP